MNGNEQTAFYLTGMVKYDLDSVEIDEILAHSNLSTEKDKVGDCINALIDYVVKNVIWTPIGPIVDMSPITEQ